MKTLTKRVCEEYCASREQQSYMSMFYDSKSKKMLIVPYDKSHVEYAAEVIGVREEELNGNATHLIPVTMGFTMRRRIKIDGLMVGLSSLENGLEVPHKKEDIDQAIKFLRRIIYKRRFAKSKNYKEAVFYGFGDK